MSKEGVAVGVRVRPMLQEQTGDQQCVRVQGSKVTVSGSHRLRQFPIQYIFDRTTPQQQVFELFALPLLEDLFKGYNCCLVAYGQNRSGKSFTICGGDTQQTKGIIPRIVDHLTCKLYTQENSRRRIILRVSYVDIHKEEVIDLLSIRKGVVVEVTESKDHQISLNNVEMKTITALEDIESSLIIGNHKRQLAYSKKYRTSEQSSSVFTLYLESIQDGKVKKGKLDIVEMQANEVVPRFQLPFPLTPKQYDLSVNSFKNVVNGLIYGSNDTVIPYNDSKVTQILRNALGGNSKTKILFHICASAKSHHATISTLRTASACQLIENTPNYNFTEHSLIKQVIEQEEGLKKQLKIVEQDIKKHQSEVEEVDQQHQQVDGENQFLSKSVVSRKRREQKENAQQKRFQMRQSIKKQIQNMQSLFLTLPALKNKHQITFFKDNYTSALDRLAKNAHTVTPLASLYESAENWSLSETNFRKLNQRQRFYKQEVYDLQRQFQQERQLLLSTLREMTQQCRFYQQVAQRAVRPQEIQLLRSSSKYDPTKRIFKVPSFAIRDKRITHSSRYFSPQQNALINSRAISQRKFMMTQIGEKSRDSRVTEIKKINIDNAQENPYFSRAAKRPQTTKQEGPFRMSQDQYQLVRSSVMSNKFKRKMIQQQQADPRSPSNSSRSVKVKPIKLILSPRFRFK